jgi:hypothetical protein
VGPVFALAPGMNARALVFISIWFSLGCFVGDPIAVDGGPLMDSAVEDHTMGKCDACMDAGDAAADTGTDGAMDATVDSPADAATDASADASDGGFDVKSVSGLVLWLDGAKGLTKNNQNQVSKWADQSPSANDAVQGASANQPVWNSSVINSLPALHFDASNSQVMKITDVASLRWGQGDWLVEVVARFDNAVNSNNPYPCLYSKFDQQFGVILTGNDAVNVATGLTAVLSGSDIFTTSGMYNDNKARNYALRRNGNSIEIRVNQQIVLAQNQSGSINVDATGTDALIGAYQGQGQDQLDGDIAEIIAVKGSIASQDLSSIESYLKAKYNL